MNKNKQKNDNGMPELSAQLYSTKYVFTNDMFKC